MQVRSILGYDTRRPDITFWRSGKIDITSKLVAALGIEPGDSLDILESDDGYECLITVRPHVASGRFKAQCRPTKKGSHNMRTYCKELTEYICNRYVTDQARMMTGNKQRTPDGTIALTLINKLL